MHARPRNIGGRGSHNQGDMRICETPAEHPHLFRGQLMSVRDGDHLNIVFLHGLHNIVRVCGVTQNGQIDVCNRGTGVDSRQVKRSW